MIYLLNVDFPYGETSITKVNEAKEAFNEKYQIRPEYQVKVLRRDIDSLKSKKERLEDLLVSVNEDIEKLSKKLLDLEL